MDATSLLATEIDYEKYDDDDAHIVAYNELIELLRACAKAHAQSTDGCDQNIETAVACWLLSWKSLSLFVLLLIVTFPPAMMTAPSTGCTRL